jgi:phage terminase large subunit
MWGGRAAARSWTISRKLLIRGSEASKRILCTRELQKSIKQSVHKLLSDQIARLGLQGFYDVQQQGIYGINGTEFIFMGVKYNPEEIKSMEGIDICWIEEAHNLSESSWDIIDPTIRAEGSEIWASYNTRFKFDHIHKLFVIDKPPPKSLVINANYPDNPYFPEVLREQMETMKERDYEKYLWIWEGQIKQLAEGAIFGKQITEVKKSKRLLNVPIQKNCVVDTFFDLGKGDETAIWFMQRVGLEYHFIDYFQGRLEEIEYYTKFLKAVGYLYGIHYMPHDADHDRLGMKKNIRKQFEEGGVKPVNIVKRIKVKANAIQMARDIFPSCYFHKGRDEGPDQECDGFVECAPKDLNTRAKRAEKGMEALSNYRYVYNDDDSVYRETPHHDWASNGADAFQQFAQGYKQEKEWEPLKISTRGIV